MINKTVSRRIVRIRKKIKSANKSDRPRLCIRRSCQHIECQVIDDKIGCTKLYISTKSSDFKEKSKSNRKAAGWVGEKLASSLGKLEIGELILDRGKHRYHKNGCIDIIAKKVVSTGVKI